MKRTRVGFTLMELMVVVAILATVAGLVISKVDWVRRQANMAAGAVTSGDVALGIQNYIISTDSLPNGMDSLLDTTGALYSGPSAGNGSGGIIGIKDGVGNIPSQTAPTTVSGTADKRLNSLFRMGLSFVNDHDLTSTNATDSGTVARLIGTITSTGSASFNDSTLLLVKNNSTIWKSVYPVNVWGTPATPGGTTMTVDNLGTQVSLVALGVGPGNSMNGVTMVTPPQFPGPNSNIYYYRYVAIVAIYSDGRRAQLKTVIEPFGRTIDSSLSNYSTAGTDNLPPGGHTPE